MDQLETLLLLKYGTKRKAVQEYQDSGIRAYAFFSEDEAQILREWRLQQNLEDSYYIWDNEDELSN